MIRFRRWAEHNRRALKDVAAKRRARGIPDSAPLALQRVIVAIHLDGQFAAFAADVGGSVSVSQVQASASPSIADRAAALESDPEALRIARELDDRLEEMLSRRVDAEVRDADP